jgi:muramoyltetrapeptide carboxypeptidase LdcA involved in peptidoglycan recycling
MELSIMPLLKSGDTVGLISCSDGLQVKDHTSLIEIERRLTRLGLKTVTAKTIFRDVHSPFSGSPQERASELTRLFHDPDIRAVFDVSGGDSANQILPFLNFDDIRSAGVPFVGISDLSVLNNAIFTRTGIPAYHYRIKNLAGAFAEEQTELFTRAFMKDDPVPTFKIQWLRGKQMNGIVIGGNIRCFLKLAGTSCFPDPSGKIVFLEALGGGPARMASLLAQLDQLSVFAKCSGVLLGTFSAMQAKKMEPSIEQLVLEITERYQLPVAKTEQLGHGEDAHCLPIGLSLCLMN